MVTYAWSIILKGVGPPHISHPHFLLSFFDSNYHIYIYIYFCHLQLIWRICGYTASRWRNCPQWASLLAIIRLLISPRSLETCLPTEKGRQYCLASRIQSIQPFMLEGWKSLWASFSHSTAIFGTPMKYPKRPEPNLEEWGQLSQNVTIVYRKKHDWQWI